MSLKVHAWDVLAVSVDRLSPSWLLYSSSDPKPMASRQNSFCLSNNLPINFGLFKVFPPTSLLSGSDDSQTHCTRFRTWFYLFLEILSSLGTHRQQVEQVCVGIDVRRCSLDERQLLEDSVQLLGLGQIDPRFLFVDPIWQRHVHCYEVFQVHTQDRESKTQALREALAVLTVVPAWCHQFDEVVKNLKGEQMQKGLKWT